MPGRAASSRWPIPAALLLACLVAAGGCGTGAFARLRSEDDVARYAALKAEAADQPVETATIETRLVGDAAPIALAVHETGRADAPRAIVLLHGVFADSRSWRFLRGPLGRDHRIIMVDLPGCGCSPAPRAGDLGPGALTPDALAERLCLVLERHFEDVPPPRRITFVGHSLAGTIAFRMLGDPERRDRHAALLDRVDGLVLIAPADVEQVNLPPLMVRLATVSGLEIALGDAVGVLPDMIARGVAGAVVEPDAALREDAVACHAALTDAGSRRALQAMLHGAIPVRDGRYRPAWGEIERLVADYANVDVETLILWGARDETLPVALGYKLAAQLPRATLYVVPECKHSVHLEHPELVIDAIDQFAATRTVALPDLAPVRAAATPDEERPGAARGPVAPAD